MARHTGISNRETPEEEARERAEHPPLFRERIPRPDIGGRKAGTRSLAQKESRSRYANRETPQARKKAGAFAKEVRQKPGGGRKRR